MDAPAVLSGGCACGVVRYEIRGEIFDCTLCHCTTCRAVSGAPAVAWFSVLQQHHRQLTGAARSYRSSPHATRTFCAACGTQLTFQKDGSDEIDISTCSLDNPNAAAPKDQTFARSTLDWFEAAHRLPRHAMTRHDQKPALIRDALAPVLRFHPVT